MANQTNRSKALNLWQQLWDEYEPVNEKLYEVIEAGLCKNGALLAYGKSSNGYLDQLLNKKKPTRTDLIVLPRLVREDIARAQKFLDSLQKEVD